MQFVLEHVAGRARLAALPGGEAAEPELIGQILEQAGRFAAEELAPLNGRGDREGSRLENGVVRTPHGLARGLSQICRRRLERRPVRPGTWRPGRALG